MRELFSRLRPRPLEPVGRQTTQYDEPIKTVRLDDGIPMHASDGSSKEANIDAQPRPSSNLDADSSDDEGVSKDAQAGVQKMEATTQVWSKKHLYTAYAL